MIDANELNLEVIEVLHHVTDVDRAIEFYNGKLGWPIIWQSPGNMAMMDAGGVYQLTLVGTKSVQDWEEGTPVPPPKLAFESKNLESDVVILTGRGLVGIELSGDPKEMLYTNFSDTEGIPMMIWQDSEDGPVAQVLKEYEAKGIPDPIYKQGECIFFVNDLEASKDFYISKFGFEIHEQHGKSFYGLRLNGGPIVGLYKWTDWWDKPTDEITEAKVRLFFECEDCASEHGSQTEAGLNPGQQKSTKDGVLWFNLDDPDGNRMTFWQFKAESPA